MGKFGRGKVWRLYSLSVWQGKFGDLIRLVGNLLCKAEKPSVCLSVRTFGWSDSQPWLHGLTSDLLDVIAMSSAMTKFIFKSF